MKGRNHRTHAPAMPSWLRNLPSNSALNGRDIAVLFGFADGGSAARLAHAGSFPAADWCSHGKSQWRVDTIRIEIYRRLAVSTRAAA